jgi:hypothetical protein
VSARGGNAKKGRRLADFFQARDAVPPGPLSLAPAARGKHRGKFRPPSGADTREESPHSAPETPAQNASDY